MKKNLCEVAVMVTKYFLYGFLIQFIAFNTLLGKSGEAQLNTPIHANLRNVSVKQVFDIIKKESGFTFVYDAKNINSNRNVDIRGNDLKVQDVLNLLALKFGFSFKTIGKTITVKATVARSEAYNLPEISMARSMQPVIKYQISGIKMLQFEVSGTVADTASNPLIGVTVQVKGSKVGTTTDAQGHFEIDAPKNAILVFSYVGYATKEVPINGKAQISVTLQSSASGLNEVVVVGYGQTTKRDINSSVSTLPMQDVAPIPVQSINDAVGGRIPGVLVTATNGAPGAKAQISIRGGNAPLFVIDGIIRTQNDFENLNPNDIATYSVLKDAAATSLYGALGGNGVILVTTKKGEAGKVDINYSFNQIFSQPSINPEKMGSYDHLKAINDVYIAEGKTPPTPDSILQYYKNQTKPFLYPNTNWRSLFLRNFAPEQRHDLSISSGTRKLTYYASGSYYHQGSILKTDQNYNNRITYRLNTVSHFDNIGLKVTTGLDGYVEKNEVPNSSTANSFFGLFSHIQNHGPNQLAFNNFGLPSAQTTDNSAVELSSLSGYDRTTSRVFNGTLAMDWGVPFVPGLHLKGKGNYNMWNSMGKAWNATAPSYNNDSKSPIPGNPPSLSETWWAGNTFTLQGFLTYTQDFGKNHIDFTGVYEQSQTNNSSLSGSRQQYQIFFDQFVAGPTENQTTGGAENERASASYLGRLSYNYDSKYFLDLTTRYDGLDLFPTGKQWGLFYAVAGGWIVSSESFFQSLKDNNILDYLKLRGSFGLTGTADGIILQPLDPNPFLYVPGYNINANAWVVNGQETQGTSEQGSLPSTNFSWYSIRSWDIGLDFETLQNKLSGSVDYYYKRTTGFVVPDIRYAAVLGIGLPPINFKPGAQRRAGTEFDLRWKDQAGAFTYQLGFNFTYYDQLWERYPYEDETALEDPYTRTSGTSDAAFGNGYYAAGFYQQNSDLLEGPRRVSSVNVVAGDLRYQDTNGDGKIDGSDARRIGSNSFPHINYGFTFDLGYKGFYLDAALMGSGSRDRYLGDVIQGASVQAQLVYAFQKDYWTPDNRNAVFPRAVSSAGVNGGNNFETSDFWLLRSDYIRLKYLQFGYDFKDKLLKNSPFTNLKVFVSGTNLLTKSKSLKYFIDPESDPNNYNYPIQRTISFGINVGF
jgi:TonB-linked SusC/RagA family outer membrane protein